MTDDIPRRSRLDKMTPAENAIYNAMCVVEQAGCDVRLTEAVNLLQKARDRVADFVDGVEHPLVSYPKSEPEVLLQVIAEREDWRMREGRAQHEKALAQKRIKSLEDGIVAENRRTSVIEQELQAVKDVLIARDEDFHPKGLVSVAEVVARILGERDGAQGELDSIRSMLAETSDDSPNEYQNLKKPGETGAAVSALLSSNKNLANSLEAQSRALDAADERASTATDILCGALGPDHGRGGLRRAVGRLVVGGYGGSRRDSIALTFADRADVRRDVVLLRDQLAAWLEDRRRTTIFLSGEWRDTSDGDPSGGADVLPDHDDSSGSGAAQADVAQRGQSNEGTHGPLDRPAPPEPAGVHTIRVAWKALPPREQLRCLLSLVEEWGYYGKGLGASGAATMGDATVGGDETRAPEPAGDCRDVETKFAMSRAELSRTRAAFRNFVREYERCVPRSARLHPRMVSAEKKLDDLFLHVVEPAEPESVTAKRDSEWVWAMAQALGTNSGLSVPIVPDVEAFRKLFEKLTEDARKKEWLSLFGDLKEVDVAEANGGYCTTCRLLRRICGGEDAHDKEKVEETAGADAEAAAGTDAGGAGGGEGRGRAGPAHAPHEPPVEASARLTCTRCGGTGKVRQFVSYGEGETQGAYANESPCPACASQPVATFKTRSVHPGWAEPPKPYTKPKLTELVSREQLVAACREALKSPSWWGAFEKLARVLEG